MDNDTKTALKEALEFYADQDNYTPVHDGTHYPDGKVADDEGAKARDILGLIEREGDKITNPAILKAADKREGR